MTLHSLTLDGREYVMTPRKEWDALAARPNAGTPTLREPPPAPDGSYSIEHVRISLVNRMIAQRKAAGLTQVELARRAKLRPETICRLEAGKHMPSARTFDRIEGAIAAAAQRRKP